MLDRLTQALATARREGESVALLLVDLDDFKAVNGSAGHQVGDVALRRMGERLRGLLRQSDTVARMGGDEFALMIPGLRDPRDSLQVVEKVMAAVSAPLKVEEHELTLAASVGVAVSPQDGDTAAAMLRAADAAMYSARSAGPNAWRYSTDDLHQRARERLTLVTALSRALARDELVLHYQPQRDIRDLSLTGTEALLRWRRGDELWAAGRFIGAAEDSGLIVSIGAWVLREACQQAARWRLPVSVNVSVKQLEEADFVRFVEKALRTTGLSADLLELEVTESVVMHERGLCVEQLQRLRALGVRIAMDDFGTGYSSLSQLKHLPLTRLKVDRAFVKDLTTDLADFAVTQAVVTLGHALGLQVIAEGVEHEEQRAALQSLGCDELQGFLFGRPVPPERIEEELARRAPVA
ncbi:MAG: putative bifunctional diguanylate cyclase/phosphodiesterase [Myxococcota bacterium]